jgi:hypothetical protein
VPSWLQHVVERLLAKRPHERYQAAGEVLEDIERRRVLDRDVPAAPKRRCIRCNADVLADVALCVACGWNRFDTIREGDRDVFCASDVDDTRLREFARNALGMRNPPNRRRRTLLLGGIDAASAEMIKASATSYGLALATRERSPYVELRKALALTALCFLGRAGATTLHGGLVYYGRFVIDQLTALQVLSGSLILVLCWVCFRRFRAIDVLPLYRPGDATTAAEAEGDVWLRRVGPWLRADRSEEMKACVASSIERYLILRRNRRLRDGRLDGVLQGLLEVSAETAVVISDVERSLASSSLLDAARLHASQRELRETVDGGSTAASHPLPKSSESAARRFYEIEERIAGVRNHLISLQALFNRLVGRVVVQNLPVDAATQTLLADRIRELNAEVAIARQVRTDIEAFA